MRELPLFPLHSVLCPGIALPLHIFEPRYREMVGHCLETGSPFGVVLIRDGREVGPLAGHIADVGTTAAIRQAGRYPDGRLDIVTVGEQRFRIVSVDSSAAPYLVGTVEELDEPLGGRDVGGGGAGRGRGPAVPGVPRDAPAAGGAGAPWTARPDRGLACDRRVRCGQPRGCRGGRARRGCPDDAGDRRAQLLASARRLIAEGDATAISYLLTGLVQLDLAARQELLEIPDTTARLRRLDAHLAREQHLLKRHLRPMALDLEILGLRKN